jgi:PAS domain-containing protein
VYRNYGNLNVKRLFLAGLQCIGPDLTSLPNSPDQQVATAIDAVRARTDWQVVLDALPVPVYTTDPSGLVTYWNQACVAFAGRRPEVGRDRWCVTWQIYTTEGERLPHDRCPMAEAIQRRRAVRDEVAIALRPDGSRRAFTPYPTPLFNDVGGLIGAVNVLVDVTAEQVDVLEEQAVLCKRLSGATSDRSTTEALAKMSKGYAATAAALRVKKD